MSWIGCRQSRVSKAGIALQISISYTVPASMAYHICKNQPILKHYSELSSPGHELHIKPHRFKCPILLRLPRCFVSHSTAYAQLSSIFSPTCLLLNHSTISILSCTGSAPSSARFRTKASAAHHTMADAKFRAMHCRDPLPK